MNDETPDQPATTPEPLWLDDLQGLRTKVQQLASDNLAIISERDELANKIEVLISDRTRIEDGLQQAYTINDELKTTVEHFKDRLQNAEKENSHFRKLIVDLRQEITTLGNNLKRFGKTK